MKKRYLSSLAATTMVLLPGVALGNVSKSQVEYHGLFIGGGYGWLNIVPDEYFAQGDYAAKVYLGGQIDQNFSVEAGYIEFADYGNDNVNFKLDGYGLGLTGGLPIHHNILLYAKGGQLWWQADLNSLNDYDAADGADRFYGLGAALSLSADWDIRLEYVRYDLEFERDEIGILAGIENFDSKIDYASVGVQYIF